MKMHTHGLPDIDKRRLVVLLGPALLFFLVPLNAFSERRYSLDIENRPLFSALSNLTSQAGVDLKIKGVYRPVESVTCRFFDQTLDDGLGLLLQGLSYSCLYEQQTNGTITGLTLFIEGPDESATGQPPTRPSPLPGPIEYIPDNFAPIPQHLKETPPPRDDEQPPIEALEPPLSSEQINAHYTPISPRLKNDAPP